MSEVGTDDLPACPIATNGLTDADKCENDDGSATALNGNRAHCAGCGVAWTDSDAGVTIHGPAPSFDRSRGRGNVDARQPSAAFCRTMAFTTLALSILAIAAFYLNRAVAGLAFVGAAGLLTVVGEVVRNLRGRSV
jgi:hypothetical protein